MAFAARRAPRPWQRDSRRHPAVGIWVLAAVLAWTGYTARLILTFTPQVPPHQHPRRSGPTVRSAGVVESVANPVKTVSETVADFYKAYPQPPVLPMYRTFIVDFLTQLHLAIVDTRFKYDAIFALGMKEYYSGLMGSYDKLVASDQSEKIWKAMISALGMEPDAVTADAEAVTAYATATSPADILKQMEGGGASDAKVGQAFESIGSSLYSSSFSIGLFTMMEKSGVEVSKANAEEWGKALKITASKVTSDLETYKLNKNKLQKAEEMLREVEIREKKKLAERLEAKAKALAEKAAAKTSEAAADKPDA